MSSSGGSATPATAPVDLPGVARPEGQEEAAHLLAAQRS